MAELEYGTVVGRYRLVDANVARGATGTVRFTPIEPDEITDAETLYTRIPVDATFDGEGWLGSKDSDADSLTLAVGRWEASFRGAPGLTIKPFQFDVVADETVLLPIVQPLTPAPAVKFVVNEQVYTETIAARTAAETARDVAVQAAEDAQAPTIEVVDGRIAEKRAAADGLAPLDEDAKLPEANVPDRLTETALSATFVRFVDQNGNPLPPGSVTTIHVNTVTGDIDDITFEEA